jgi:hypothetical protein
MKTSPRPSPRSRPFHAGFLALALSVFGTGCHPKTYSTHAVGHAIAAQIEGATRSIETLPTRAIIRGDHGAVWIERDRVRIDENPWTAIPADAAIDISIDRHTVRVKAGRVTVARTTSD